MRTKSAIGFTFFLFFTLFFIGISLSINNTKTENEVKTQAKLQQIVNRFDSEIDAQLLSLSSVLQENGIAAFESKAIQLQKDNKDHLAFYLYKNHELIFWTNNQLLVPDTDSLFSIELACLKIGPHWLLTHAQDFADYRLLGVQILHVDYSLQNEFLSDPYLQSYGIKSDLQLSTKKADFNILNNEGLVLFSFRFPADDFSSNSMPYLLFFSYLLAFFSFGFSIDNALKKTQIIQIHAVTKTLVFSILTGLFLLFSVWFKFPSALFNSSLFHPQLYANNNLHLGDLFLISIWISSVVLFLNHYIPFQVKRKRSILIQILFSTIVLAGLMILYYILYLLLLSLVFDSQISLEITAITKLDFFSYTALALFLFLQLSWFILSKKLVTLLLNCLNKKTIFFLVLTVLALLFGLLPSQHPPLDQFNQFFVFFFFLSLLFFFGKKFENSFWSNVYFLILFISITGLYYTHLSAEKEKTNRKTGLSTYLLKNDPLLESHFLKEKKRIIADTSLLSELKSHQFAQDELINHIAQKYFKEATKNYEISMVFCDAKTQLLLLPQEIETPCYPFFEERIRQASDTIEDYSLYLVDQHFRTKNYIGIVEFDLGEELKTKLFVEFLSKYQPKELGMPALLSDAKNWDMRFFNNYAYAYYNGGELSDWFGQYDYKQNLESYGQNLLDDENYFSFEGYSHFVYVQDSENVLIVSKPELSWLKQIASLAFLFLFYSINLGSIFLMIYLSQNYTNLNLGFQTRLQVNMIAILLFSFFTIGFASLYYLYYLNNEKNKSVLMEKAHSVLIELEHKIQSIEAQPEEDPDYLENLLIKFSQVFFTDINLYDLDGRLLASSRPQLFDSELLSRRMNPNAFYNLGILKSSLFIHNEQIGLQEFYSVYLPFRSMENQPMAYLNLPYFAKQNELQEEISGFLVAYLNIYMFLILLTLALTILISNYLSKPLKILKDKIQRVRLETTNEKIEWKKEDEIGALIHEYNRMVEELAESAEKLARSQRESAWREMAQQIAHEIKNPLTPMKLNIQYLEKAWNEGGEDFDNKLTRITHNLTEQIDNLSDIASQFAGFAALDEIKREKIPVKSLLISSIDLFSIHKNILFKTELPEEEIYIKADRNQFIRILNNLLKNAIQSIKESSKGTIQIQLEQNNNFVEIQIADTGCGIAEAERPHIFEPRFTTKSGGMGLGLSLVKKMVENAEGSIEFDSVENKGTRFTMRFPNTYPS